MKEIDCPSCGGYWFNDLDETGVPYTCYYCCNGTLKCYEEEEKCQADISTTISTKSVILPMK
jgi:hypothetical protein